LFRGEVHRNRNKTVKTEYLPQAYIYVHSVNALHVLLLAVLSALRRRRTFGSAASSQTTGKLGFNQRRKNAESYLLLHPYLVGEFISARRSLIIGYVRKCHIAM